MKTQEPLPCPYCNTEPFINSAGQNHTTLIECSNYRNGGYEECLNGVTVVSNGLEEAVYEWNRHVKEQTAENVLDTQMKAATCAARMMTHR